MFSLYPSLIFPYVELLIIVGYQCPRQEHAVMSRAQSIGISKEQNIKVFRPQRQVFKRATLLMHMLKQYNINMHNVARLYEAVD